MPETWKQGKRFEQSKPETRRAEQHDGEQADGCDHGKCDRAGACVACQNDEKYVCYDDEQQLQNVSARNACVLYASTSWKGAHGAGCPRTKTERSGRRPVQQS